MSRAPTSLSAKLVSLLDQRDHLHILISLAADEPLVDVDKVTKLSTLLAEIECAITEERNKLGV